MVISRKIKKKKTSIGKRKVKEINVTYGKTISENYNSVKISLGVTREIEEGERYIDAIREELETLKALTEEKVWFVN
jgi:hypothetical protein